MSRARHSRPAALRLQWRQLNLRTAHVNIGGDECVAGIVRAISRNLTSTYKYTGWATAATTGDITLFADATDGATTSAFDSSHSLISSSSTIDLSATDTDTLAEVIAAINTPGVYVSGTQLFEAVALDGISTFAPDSAILANQTNAPVVPDTELLSSASAADQSIGGEPNYGSEVIKIDYSAANVAYYLCTPFRNFGRKDGHEYQVEILKLRYSIAAPGSGGTFTVYEVDSNNTSQGTVVSGSLSSGTNNAFDFTTAAGAHGYVSHPGNDILVDITLGTTPTPNTADYIEVVYTYY